ncbi:MAG: hypothetical protein NTW74_15480 [Acidobacteria bacterium]|nr:hypothetical protein [Acidobacteriota bacterium]
MNNGSTDTDLQKLDSKLRTILPEEYQECYEDLKPLSMGSAGLKFDASGRVAWDEIWRTFCDLAMAGGPPHRGTLLEPGNASEIESQPEQYQIVVEEICRGIRMVTGLTVCHSLNPGWVHLTCTDAGMATWMTRAITMENISARADNSIVSLPAGPHFRLEKEIKNVVTSVAKTAHYYVGHIGPAQQRAIAELFEKADAIAPLLQPGIPNGLQDESTIRALRDHVAQELRRKTGLPSSGPEYLGWLGLKCISLRAAIWLMRALVVNSVLARREGTVLFVPIDPALDPAGDRLVQAVLEARSLALRKGIVVDA